MPASHHKLAIIGTGPAGYTAAIYASRARLAPLVFEGGQSGGQLTVTTEVENYPGFKDGVLGPALMDEMRQQAVKFGAQLLPETVERVDLANRPFRLVTSKGDYACDALIVATGASARWLGLGKDIELSRSGGGVSGCATCDGYFYRGKEVAVVGGGDTALEDATFLTKFATKVTLIHRRDRLRASKAMQERAFRNGKIQFAWNKIVDGILTEMRSLPSGETQEMIRGLRLKDALTGELSELSLDGLFVAIGHKPNTELFEGQLALDAAGYIVVEKGSSRTQIEGVFAAGDVQDHTYRQAITAAGSGCMAALDAERWLASKGLDE